MRLITKLTMQEARPENLEHIPVESREAVLKWFRGESQWPGEGGTWVRPRRPTRYDYESNKTVVEEPTGFETLNGYEISVRQAAHLWRALVHGQVSIEPGLARAMAAHAAGKKVEEDDEDAIITRCEQKLGHAGYNIALYRQNEWVGAREHYEFNGPGLLMVGCQMIAISEIVRVAHMVGWKGKVTNLPPLIENLPGEESL